MSAFFFYFLHTNKKIKMTLITLINKCFLYVIKNIEKDIDAHYDLLSLID